ncbi:hypothetical protein NC651_028970 [Populus alba x Populus x berolinensis]|nr:hypothetical protein NC651_028970 [Populus alba x Populus x berolinensis]
MDLVPQPKKVGSKCFNQQATNQCFFIFFLAWADIRLANAKFLATLKIGRAPFSLLQPCIYYLQVHTDTIA